MPNFSLYLRQNTLEKLCKIARCFQGSNSCKIKEKHKKINKKKNKRYCKSLTPPMAIEGTKEISIASVLSPYFFNISLVLRIFLQFFAELTSIFKRLEH